MEKPNLFSFAASELSQDAFLCWLISWAKPEHKNENKKLHTAANKFIEKLAEGINIDNIKKLDVRKQEKLK